MVWVFRFSARPFGSQTRVLVRKGWADMAALSIRTAQLLPRMRFGEWAVGGQGLIGNYRRPEGSRKDERTEPGRKERHATANISQTQAKNSRSGLTASSVAIP